jgi:predicted metal-dependent hydrolase
MQTFILIILFVVFMTAWYLIKTNYEHYLENEPTVMRLRNKLSPIFPELKFVKMMKGNSSYTINKQKIYLCTEANGEVYDDNMLTYVTLHELAHTMCPEIGHGEQFQSIFQTLLGRAERHKLFDPRKPRIEKYCKTKK